MEIDGKPMIQWVVDAASQSKAAAVWVATDDERIAKAVRNPRGAQSIVVMTRAEHLSGTDRIAEVATKLKLADDTIIVNVQGDEPKLPPVLIDQVASLLANDASAAMATLSTPITHRDEFLDPNVVKVITTVGGIALYFSRAPIPWNRDGAARGLESQTHFSAAQRHLGIYAYRVAALLQMTAWPPGELEQIEKLEQLRAMQAGLRIRVAQAIATPGIGVDTPADLERIKTTS